MVFTMILLFGLIGGWLSRMCGGAPPKLYFGVDQFLYAYPYALVASYFLISLPSYLFPAAFSVAYIAAIVGKRTGHGGGMDLGHSPEEPGQGRTPEKLEYLILGLHGRIDQYWYDALLLAITGMAVTLVPGLILMVADPFWGAVVAVSGITKAHAYLIGWCIYPNGGGRGIPHLNKATAIGEFLTGFMGYTILGLAFYEVFYAG